MRVTSAVVAPNWLSFASLYVRDTGLLFVSINYLSNMLINEQWKPACVTVIMQNGVAGRSQLADDDDDDDSLL